jgi:hypothetical protein
MWCESVGFVCWLAPLLILQSVGFSVVFCRFVNVRSVSRGIGHNVLHIYEVAAFENRCFILALNFL